MIVLLNCDDKLGLGGRKVVLWLGSGKELGYGDVVYVSNNLCML